MKLRMGKRLSGFCFHELQSHWDETTVLVEARTGTVLSFCAESSRTTTARTADRAGACAVRLASALVGRKSCQKASATTMITKPPVAAVLVLAMPMSLAHVNPAVLSAAAVVKAPVATVDASAEGAAMAAPAASTAARVDAVDLTPRCES